MTNATTKTATREGIFFDMPEDEYHADPALGSTDIRRLLASGPDFWWQSSFNPQRPEREDTPYLEFGRALHRLVLEGNQQFHSRYVRRPDDLARLDAKAKAQLAPNGEIVLDGDDFDRIEISADMIRRNPDLASAFEGGASEVSVFWDEVIDDVAVPCKARFDYLKVRGVGDLKSIRNYRGLAFSEACTRAIVEHRYDIQAAHYLIGRARIPEFVAHDLVFGDHNAEWLKRVASSDVYAFQWIFFQADSAPITWSRSLSVGNPVLDIAGRDRAKALETFANYIKEFGTERMWTYTADVSELDINEMPRWFK